MGSGKGSSGRSILADRVPKPGPGAVVYVPAKVIREEGQQLGRACLATVAQVLGVLDDHHRGRDRN